MKNYHYKMILSSFIIGELVLLLDGILIQIGCSKFEGYSEVKNIITIIIIATMCGLGVISIIFGILTYKKWVKPMSRMLKSGSPYDKLEYLQTDNKDFDNALNELKENLRIADNQKIQTDTMLKYMTDGVIAFDTDGNVIYINPEAIKLLELNDSQRTFNEIFEKYKDINMEKIIYLENLASSEKKIENNQGTMNLFFVPFKDDENIPTGLMVVIQDITEHVKLDNMRKDFVANVSHELKTPLTSIKGFAETLIDNEDADVKQKRHWIEVIYDNSVRMEKIVQDLLTLSKYDKKEEESEATNFDLGTLAKKCCEKFEIEVKRKKQKLECYVTANVPPVHADYDGIERVIINIISNSVKYTKEGGTISVYVGYLTDAYVKVKDNGIGIPKEDLDKIFERFYRVDKARSRQMGGTGLGLSIAKEIIEKNNGNIDIKSEIGKGTEVVLRIPIMKGQETNK